MTNTTTNTNTTAADEAIADIAVYYNKQLAAAISTANGARALGNLAAEQAALAECSAIMADFYRDSAIVRWLHSD